jgi:hypothetical protein
MRASCDMPVSHWMRGDRLKKIFSRSRLASLGARALYHTCMPYMILYHWRIRVYANYKYLCALCDMPALHYMRSDRLKKIFSRSRLASLSARALCRTCHIWHAIMHYAANAMIFPHWRIRSRGYHFNVVYSICVHRDVPARLCARISHRISSPSPTPPTPSVKEWLSTPFSCFYAALAYLIIYGIFFLTVVNGSQFSSVNNFVIYMSIQVSSGQVQVLVEYYKSYYRSYFYHFRFDRKSGRKVQFWPRISRKRC